MPEEAVTGRGPVAASDRPDTGSARSERRMLTALCYDLVGSTVLLSTLDIEDYQELIRSFQHQAGEALAAHGGTLVSEAGDGGLALFSTGIDARDAAALAVRAGFDIIAASHRAGTGSGRADLHVRIGIASSMILVMEEPDRLALQSATGPALAMATRLQSLACADCIYVSHETRRLARRSHNFSFQGSHTIRGFAEPQPVWRAIRRKREVDRFLAFGRVRSRLVGRGPELHRLAECLEEAVAGRGQVVLIDGEAGIGKSRLVHEIRNFTRRDMARLLFFQCLPGGAHTVLHPMLHGLPSEMTDGGRKITAHALGRLFRAQGISEAEVCDIFAFLLGAEGAEPSLKELEPDAIRRKANWAVRQCIDMVCAMGPVVLVVEDVHWIDPTSRELLAEVIGFSREYPLLVLVTARDDTASAWFPASNFHTIRLGPLDAQDTRVAISLHWPEGVPPGPPDLLDMVERVTGGVPLFIEEICRWAANSAPRDTESLALGTSIGPASILETVIDARLNSLGEAKEVARAAAVARNRFSPGLLRGMLASIDDQAIEQALEQLSEAGLLVRLRPLAECAYRFRHTLLQETIYGAILKRRRSEFHARLFTMVSRDRSLAPWIDTANLARHAEAAGLQEQAISLFVQSGTETYSRSAMVEARQLLEHALQLTDSIGDAARQDVLRLSAMAALGPVLTSSEGPSSIPARQLYDEGVAIARRRPVTERAKWFPIYWGWWFTGTDIDGERARAVLHDLTDVEDDEVQLQARHCVWAIEFYIGHHESCITAADEGLAHYARRSTAHGVTLFGGHDAKVCGLAHRGLSQWFTGKPARARQSLADAKDWALQLGHVGSLAHIYNNGAMLNCYRRDYDALRKDVAAMRELTASHLLPSLAATAQILDGWCDGLAGDIGRGIAMIREALAIHRKLQTPEDYPVYCGLLAELLALQGEPFAGLELLTDVMQQSSHRYWLAELHRQRAVLLHRSGADPDNILAALAEGLSIAAQQDAVPILLNIYDDLLSVNHGAELAARYRDRVDLAARSIEPGEPLFANPQPVAMNEPNSS